MKNTPTMTEDGNTDNLFYQIISKLKHLDGLSRYEYPVFLTDGDIILSWHKESIKVLAALLKDSGLVAVTGYYDPKEDQKNGCVDKYTGYYYLDIE